MFTYLSLLLLATTLALNPYQTEWEAFKKTYNRKYTTEKEERGRIQVFVKNLKKIKAHNALYDKGQSTYEMGVNKFSDWFPDELAALRGFRASSSGSSFKVQYPSDLKGNPPSAIDWREKGAVTEVKRQGDCMSCWAFSAAGALEGLHFIKTGELVTLSAQNLIDCASKHGCRGGFMPVAFKYVQENGGIDAEWYYPYLEGEAGMCLFRKSGIGATCTGYREIEPGNEKQLKEAVGLAGPVSAAVDANFDDFINYKSGIFYSTKCGNTLGHIDHGVLVVGYGTKGGKDFWIVKNAWGKDWGDKGYILMSRNRNNNCGIATYASYPVDNSLKMLSNISVNDFINLY